MSKIGLVEGLAARLFGLELHTSDACSSCGLCEAECPEKNIRMNKAHQPVFGLNCLMCLAAFITVRKTPSALDYPNSFP